MVKVGAGDGVSQKRKKAEPSTLTEVKEKKFNVSLTFSTVNWRLLKKIN